MEASVWLYDSIDYIHATIFTSTARVGDGSFKGVCPRLSRSAGGSHIAATIPKMLGHEDISEK